MTDEYGEIDFIQGEKSDVAKRWKIDGFDGDFGIIGTTRDSNFNISLIYTRFPIISVFSSQAISGKLVYRTFFGSIINYES